MKLLVTDDVFDKQADHFQKNFHCILLSERSVNWAADQTRLGMTIPLSMVLPFNRSLTLLLTEESHDLKLYRLLLVKVNALNALYKCK